VSGTKTNPAAAATSAVRDAVNRIAMIAASAAARYNHALAPRARRLRYSASGIASATVSARSFGSKPAAAYRR